MNMKLFIAWILSWFKKANPPISIIEYKEKAAPFSAKEFRNRWRPVIAWCANHAGQGFKRVKRAPAPGWFWKRDREGRQWRLYRISGNQA
jgi:hypothetical protein